MNITSWDPFRDFGIFVDRYARDFGADVQAQAPAEKVWSPRVDIKEVEKAFLVKAELPGVEKDDVTVAIEKGVLTIKGEKKLGEAGDGEKYHRVERVYGGFTRQFSLPDEVDTDAVEASYKNGVLMLTIPKAEAEQPKLIDVKIH